MDVFAHALYGGALGKALQKTGIRNKPSVKWSLFWGAFPDIVPFLAGVFFALTTDFFTETMLASLFTGFGALYPFTHSLVIFVIVFLFVRLVARRWMLSMLAWPLHILMDIPLHTPDTFPTPFLFPLSDWTLPFGISWATPSIWISVWVVLALIWGYFYLSEKKKNT